MNAIKWACLFYAISAPFAVLIGFLHKDVFLGLISWVCLTLIQWLIYTIIYHSQDRGSRK